MNTIGNKIKQLRKHRGMYQKDLADILQVDQTTISNWENDKRLPDLHTIRAISEIFKVSINDLVRARDESAKLFPEAQENLINKVFEGENKKQPLTAANIRENYEIIIDGREATDEELEKALEHIRLLRLLKEQKN